MITNLVYNMVYFLLIVIFNLLNYFFLLLYNYQLHRHSHYLMTIITITRKKV